MNVRTFTIPQAQNSVYLTIGIVTFFYTAYNVHVLLIHVCGTGCIA